MLAIADPEGLDNGPRAKSAPERMCAVTRQVAPVSGLIRFVVAPTGEVIADLKRKLPGRGLWVTCSRATVTEAVRRGSFPKGFKRAVQVSPALPADIERLLVVGLVEALAIAAKAGQVAAGFTKVEAALAAGQTVALLHAVDGAADGIRKLAATARKNEAESPEIPTFAVLTTAELDLALGRSNVVHAALLAGSASKTMLARCRALVQYRSADETRETQH